MAIDVMKGVLAAGVGVADELVADWDESTTPPRTEPFKTAQDLGRLGLVLVGYGVQAFQPRYSNLGDTIATASMPLLVKSVWNAVAAQGTTRRVTYTPRRTKQAARYPAPAYEPQFEGVRLD